MPSSITVEDGSGNIGGEVSYAYDSGSVITTSGTPQHISITGSRGNATTINFFYQTGRALVRGYTYYDTGNVSVATDVNSAQTTYTYGSASCGNSFPTSVAEPMSLSKSITWNCTGGVETSVTDENGEISAVGYTDPYFWRPNSVTDQETNTTNIDYTTASGSTDAAIETSLVVGSGSTSDFRLTLDGLARSLVSQVKESPTSGNYDSIETDYDVVGRGSRTSLPYSATSGSVNSSAPGRNATYDTLNRTTQVTDSSGLNTTYSYSQNDAYMTIGPSPSGENTKRRQNEYDSLGRLTSVCEVTNLSGSGACAQTNGTTGYWTVYTYNVLNLLTGVTQNAQSSSQTQTRSYAYDELGRTTSEVNPESGSASYTYAYDTDTTCGTSNGDIVKKIDAAGNIICYTYDNLHRVTSAVVQSGPYSTSTPQRHFVYDSATVNGIGMSNTKGRLAEAYTCVSPCTAKITDIGFSYTARGEISDDYESTPNSGAYYHVSVGRWPNFAPHVLNAQYGSNSINGFPTITYNLDGEGRIYSVSASSGQSPLTSTSYNYASQPTAVNLGSSDSDGFTYDPNSNRVTEYQFNINGQSLNGTLTWNAVGTLESLAVVDPFYSTGNQTCSYSHDDMSRIASANCGAVWSQTFSYDAFGNLSKSGTQSFVPTYSSATNHMTLIGGSTPSYDSNGNVTNDFLHVYSWDANARPLTVDGVSITYDALGRMVEQSHAGSYYQMVYAPAGAKLMILQQGTLQKAFVPLPGGSMAVYTSTGLSYYRHSDWIGSSRLASTPSRTVYYDGAYAPFGEPYAQTGTTDLSFTNMHQDIVSNLYDFPAREYGIQGRWPSPDPAGLSSVRLSDPQTLNRYAYVRNSPLNVIDPNGTCPGDIDNGGSSDDGNDGDDGDDGSDGGDGDSSDVIMRGSHITHHGLVFSGRGVGHPHSMMICSGNNGDNNDGSNTNNGGGADQCNNDTCSSVNVCTSSGCVNSTTVIVNGNDASMNDFTTVPGQQAYSPWNPPWLPGNIYRPPPPSVTPNVPSSTPNPTEPPPTIDGTPDELKEMMKLTELVAHLAADVFGEISVIVMPNPCLNATSTNPTPVGCSGTI
jgi:RHS repeat-associated protein